MNIFIRLKASLLLREAILKAEKAHRKTGERYYVMPSYGGEGKLIVMDRYNFRQLKHKGYITRNARVCDMVNEAFYFTPYRNGDGRLAEKDRKDKAMRFFTWIEADRKARKKPKYRRYGKV
ncbi:MAG: hypothetical protein LUC45_05480 [Paraprevotella sp.]|nr:hypothetical protein [Paraprevotella sp.]